MDFLTNNLALLLPLVVVQIGFGLIALVHVLKHPHYRFGNKVMWAVVVMLVTIIGPVIYFAFGRGEES